MSDYASAGRSSLRRQFPALRIPEAATIALSPASVAIACTAILLLMVADGMIQTVLPRVSGGSSLVISRGPGESPDPATDVPAEGQLTAVTTVPVTWGLPFPGSAGSPALILPWTNVTRPAIDVLERPPGQTGRLNGMARFAVALGIWSLAGTILCRRSAMIFAGNDDSTAVRAIDYGVQHWWASVGAPAIPLISAILIALFEAAVGLIGWLPYVGPSSLLLMSPVIAIAGFAMAFLLLATAFGWPLMVAAISTDDCDSFGGLSRAYSALTGRPWHAIGFTALAFFGGAVLMAIFRTLAETTIWCAMSGTAFGSGDERAVGSLVVPVTWLVQGLVSGIGASYFWSAATVISLLLRQAVDGVPVDRIAPDSVDRPPREPLPVVGIPATDARPMVNGHVTTPDE
jgi:hypothetical protein